MLFAKRVIGLWDLHIEHMFSFLISELKIVVSIKLCCEISLRILRVKQSLKRGEVANMRLPFLAETLHGGMNGRTLL